MSQKQRILEIIADDPNDYRNRTSSYEINVSQEVQDFLKKAKLEFLLEYFNDKA